MQGRAKVDQHRHPATGNETKVEIAMGAFPFVEEWHEAVALLDARESVEH